MSFPPEKGIDFCLHQRMMRRTGRREEEGVVLRRAVVGVLVILSAAVPATTVRAGTAPPGATAKCRDGTYSFSQHHSGTCSYHGGVAVWLDGSATSPTTSGSSSGESGDRAGGCGVERWTVKTLQDRPHLLPAKKTTVHFLVTRPAPSTLPSTRLPFERAVYTVVAAVSLVRHEADSDFHLVLQDGSEHMIAESPSPSCDSNATPLRRQQMAVVRSEVRVCARARLTGVAFFDFNHGQTGVAPNAIELHPILAFTCLKG